MAGKTYAQMALILWVIVSGSAAASGLLPDPEWAKFIAGINSGVLAWGLIRRPAPPQGDKTPKVNQ